MSKRRNFTSKMTSKDFQKAVQDRPPKANHLTSEIVHYLSHIGWNVWRQNNLAAPGRTFQGRLGVSDIIGTNKEGLFVAIEIKVGNDKLSKDQESFLQEIKSKGGIALVAKTWPQFFKDIQPYLK